MPFPGKLARQFAFCSSENGHWICQRYPEERGGDSRLSLKSERFSVGPFIVLSVPLGKLLPFGFSAEGTGKVLGWFLDMFLKEPVSFEASLLLSTG